VALAVAWLVMPGPGGGGPLDRLSSILGLIEGRSPGERSKVLTLSKTKGPTGGRIDEIQERVLGKVFPQETFVEGLAAESPLPLKDISALPLPADAFAPSQTLDLPGVGAPGPGFNSGTGGGLAVGGPGGSGGGNPNSGIEFSFADQVKVPSQGYR
jgi:hypothetical protein